MSDFEVVKPLAQGAIGKVINKNCLIKYEIIIFIKALIIYFNLNRFLWLKENMIRNIML